MLGPGGDPTDALELAKIQADGVNLHGLAPLNFRF